MGQIDQIIYNRILWTAVFSWFIAQFIKIVIELIRTRKLNLFLLFSSGGMPSSHTAFVVAAATAVGIKEGLDSTFFAIAAVIAIIVMYDAAGVRRAAGKQAEVLNRLISTLDDPDVLIDQKLKEVLGHNPLQVIAGAVLGIIVGVAVG